MAAPSCSRCKAVLTDWQGNVMIPFGDCAAGATISRLHILCKRCTAELDGAGVGHNDHNLWELSWAGKDILWLLSYVVGGLRPGQPSRWSPQALGDFLNLAKLVFPTAIPGTDKDSATFRFLVEHVIQDFMAGNGSKWSNDALNDFLALAKNVLAGSGKSSRRRKERGALAMRVALDASPDQSR